MAEEGHDIPAVRDFAALPADLIWVLEGFGLLSQSRPSGPGPIPISEVLAYAQIYSISDIPGLLRMIRAMDLEYLKIKVDKGD